MTTPEKIRRRQRALILLQGLTGLLAVTALIVTLVVQDQGRYDARYQSCQLLRAVVLVATLPKRKAEAYRFIRHTELANCKYYANNVPAPKGITK